METSEKLTPLQLELLKIYSFHPTDEDMLELRRILGKYFGQKYSLQITERAKELGYTQEDFQRWLNDDGA